MINNPYCFDEVTLLVTHYNRSASLERLLKGFVEIQCAFGEMVVSDDGSNAEHYTRIKELQNKYGFKLITALQNKGLGNNINKGQDAVNKPYTLYIQEDFVPKTSFAIHFKNALTFMQQDKTLDTVRFYAYFKYPYTKPFGNGFSEMIYKKELWHANHLKFYCYSDHPHLRRSDFLNKFGRYKEGIKGDLTELHMALSFLKKKGRGLIYDDFTGIIDQKNNSNEPSTMKRSNWRASKNIFALILRSFFLKYKLLKNTFRLIAYK